MTRRAAQTGQCYANSTPHSKGRPEDVLTQNQGSRLSRLPGLRQLPSNIRTRETGLPGMGHIGTEGLAGGRPPVIAKLQ